MGGVRLDTRYNIACALLSTRNNIFLLLELCDIFLTTNISIFTAIWTNFEFLNFIGNVIQKEPQLLSSLTAQHCSCFTFVFSLNIDEILHVRTHVLITSMRGGR